MGRSKNRYWPVKLRLLLLQLLVGALMVSLLSACSEDSVQIVREGSSGSSAPDSIESLESIESHSANTGESNTHPIGDDSRVRFNFEVSKQNFISLQKSRAKGKRIVVLGIDGVPYGVFRDFQKKGFFRNFKSPSKMVSTFPALSQYAWSKILNLGHVNTYQDTFVEDGDSKRIKNYSLNSRYSEVPVKMDYKNKNLVKKLSSYVTDGVKTLKFELDELEKVILKENKRRIFYTVLSGADAIVHLRGVESAEILLEMFDDFIVNAKRKHFEKYGEDVFFILVSDHGNTLEKSILPEVSIKDHLEKFNFHVKSKLKSDNDVVVTSIGLISVAPFWVKDKRREELSEALTSIPEIDLVVTKSLDKELYSVLDAEGKLVFSYSENKNAFRIDEIIGKDPLELTKLGLEKDKWIPQKEVMSVSLLSEYPNSLMRIRNGLLKKNVNFPANVVASFKNGVEFSHVGFFKIYSRMKKNRSGTHGDLHRKSSIGFISSDIVDFPEWVPAYDVPSFIPGLLENLRYEPISMSLSAGDRNSIRIGHKILELPKIKSIELDITWDKNTEKMMTWKGKVDISKASSESSKYPFVDIPVKFEFQDKSYQLKIRVLDENDNELVKVRSITKKVNNWHSHWVFKVNFNRKMEKK